MSQLLKTDVHMDDIMLIIHGCPFCVCVSHCCASVAFFLRTQGTSTTTGEQGDITTVVGTNDCLFCYSFHFLFPFSYLNLFEVDKQTWSLSPVVAAVQLTHGCKQVT